LTISIADSSSLELAVASELTTASLLVFDTAALSVSGAAAGGADDAQAAMPANIAVETISLIILSPVLIGFNW